MIPNRQSYTINRKVTLIACLLLLLGLWNWVEARSLASKQNSHGALVGQIEQMHADVQRLKVLRGAPRAATDRERPNDELLAQIRDAMDRAGMPAKRWIGNDPALPVRVPRSPYKRLSTRLSFERVTLPDLVTFAFYLTENDRALRISHIRLVAPRGDDPETWTAELTITYLIYSPYLHPHR